MRRKVQGKNSQKTKEKIKGDVSLSGRKLKALVERRRQLLDLVNQENNRLQ